MEIKIKDQNGYIEAEWTIEDGVMIVSPKKNEKIDLSQFKSGDVLFCSHNRLQWLCIYKDEIEYVGDNIYMEDYCSLNLDGDKALYIKADYSDSATFVRHATEEERNKLFKALADEGWEWDVKERKLVKLKWKPKVGEMCYYPLFINDDLEFEVSTFKYEHQVDVDNDPCIPRGWVFCTEAECKEFCDKLNKAIEGVNP